MPGTPVFHPGIGEMKKESFLVGMGALLETMSRLCKALDWYFFGEYAVSHVAQRASSINQTLP
jgi:hypothetical protein